MSDDPENPRVQSSQAEADEPPVRSDAEIAATLRLRPRRPPVMQLSRRAIVVLVGGAALATGGALALALHTPKARSAPKELYNVEHKPAADGLARLPGDYAGLQSANGSASAPVPELGPPLPGDLGRPILKAGGATPGSLSSDGAQTPVDQARQRAEQAREAAQTSGLFTAGAKTDAGPLDHGAGPAAPTPTPIAGLGGLGPDAASAALATGHETGPSADADHKSAFLNAGADHQIASLERLQAPASPYCLQAGGIIAAALVTGLRSDLPGPVTAQVTENVYDSPTGRFLLIPQGSRLIGQYDAQVAFGQSRTLLAWTRLILPDGRSVVLERQPTADPQGYAGLQDRLDNHWGQLFKAAALSTILSVGADTGTSANDSGLVSALRQGASDSISQVGRQVVGRSLTVQPTINIRPGFPVRVIVTRDLVLEPWPNGEPRP